MSRQYDPRAKRPNPELKEWERVIASGCADFRKAATVAEKRGHAQVLMAKLELYLDEPAEVTDLLPGAQPATPAPLDLGGGEVADRSPFSAFTPGDPAEFFFYAHGGTITPLVTADQLQQIDPWSLSGYWVLRLRRLHLAGRETAMHFSDESAVERCHPPLRRFDIWRERFYMVLLDPAGVGARAKAPLLFQSASLDEAVATAEELAKWLEIRCLVARLEGAIHTH